MGAHIDTDTTKIARQRVTPMIQDANNIFTLAAQGRIRISEMYAPRMSQIKMSIQNLLGQIQVKIKGGQIFAPPTDECQCLIADGDQKFTIPNGNHTIAFNTQCSQCGKRAPSGDRYNITNKKLKGYRPGMTQSQTWVLQRLKPEDLKDEQSVIEILSGIKGSLQRFKNSLSVPQ